MLDYVIPYLNLVAAIEPSDNPNIAELGSPYVCRGGRSCKLVIRPIAGK